MNHSRNTFFQKELILLLFLFLLVDISYAQIKIKAVGDIMLGSLTPASVLPSNNGKVFVDSIGRQLTCLPARQECADIVFGNLEGTFVKDNMKPIKAIF